MPHLLVVDDDEEDVVLLREFLAAGLGADLVVHTAASLAEGLDRLAREPIELCLVDWRIGQASGIAFLEQARSVRNVPMVLLTGAGDPAVDRAAQDAGAAYYVEKAGLSAERLERVVRYCLGHLPKAAPNRDLHPEREGSIGGECPRILLIDDDEDDYLLTRELLGEVFGGRLRLE